MLVGNGLTVLQLFLASEVTIHREPYTLFNENAFLLMKLTDLLYAILYSQETPSIPNTYHKLEAELLCELYNII